MQASPRHVVVPGLRMASKSKTLLGGDTQSAVGPTIGGFAARAHRPSIAPNGTTLNPNNSNNFIQSTASERNGQKPVKLELYMHAPAESVATENAPQALSNAEELKQSAPGNDRRPRNGN